MRPDRPFKLRLVAAVLAPAMLAGCISFGAEPPPTLFNLTPTAMQPAGSGQTTLAEQTLAVMDIEAPRKLQVLRVPVQIDDANIAYLQEAQWVEVPTNLFAALLAETIRTRGNRVVVETGEARFAADTQLTGTLREMGYDARTGSVVVRYDAVIRNENGVLRTQRFEASVPGVAAEAEFVAPALNQAANEVAVAVADWIGG